MDKWRSVEEFPPKYDDETSFEVEVLDALGATYPAHYCFNVGDWYTRDGELAEDVLSWRYYSGVDAKKEPRTRGEFLDEAKRCITGQREQDYGSPEDNFRIIAKMWSAYLGVDVSSLDVSMMMCLLKIARVKNGGGTGDSFVDLAGYAACGGEIRASTKETQVAEGRND